MPIQKLAPMNQKKILIWWVGCWKRWYIFLIFLRKNNIRLPIRIFIIPLACYCFILSICLEIIYAFLQRLIDHTVLITQFEHCLNFKHAKQGSSNIWELQSSYNWVDRVFRTWDMGTNLKWGFLDYNFRVNSRKIRLKHIYTHTSCISFKPP